MKENKMPHMYETLDHACEALKSKVLIQGSYVKAHNKIYVVKLQSIEDPAICYYVTRVGRFGKWIRGASAEGIMKSLYKKW